MALLSSGSGRSMVASVAREGILELLMTAGSCYTLLLLGLLQLCLGLGFCCGLWAMGYGLLLLLFIFLF